MSSTDPASRSVLIVDDDPAILRMTALVLESEGYVVITASSAEEGLAQVSARHVDVLLLDLQMPQMDGRAMYRELRARHHDCAVVIVSAYGAEAARAELGATAAITKPFDIDDMLDRLAALAAN